MIHSRMPPPVSYAAWRCSHHHSHHHGRYLPCLKRMAALPPKCEAIGVLQQLKRLPLLRGRG